MSTPVTVARSRVVPAPVTVAFETALATPLPELYRRRYGPLPPIVAVRDQQGAWETPGQSRVFTLADGGSMREDLLSLERPRRFVNRLTVLGGPFKPLVDTVEESWSFAAAGAGTEATWEWNLYARSTLTRPLVAVVARLWRGYARKVLEQLEVEVRRAQLRDGEQLPD